LAGDFAKNEEVRKVLLEHGDDGRSVRLIQHYAYFATAEAASQYREFVSARGYQLDREANDASQPRPWSIVFSKLQAPKDIDSEAGLLDLSAVKLGGEYDGWETKVNRN
jgi:hypothetical protein